MSQTQFKVVRVDRGGSRIPMENEARELAKVGAELIGADSSSEEETIEAAKDADSNRCSTDNTPCNGGITKITGSRPLWHRLRYR